MGLVWYLAIHSTKFFKNIFEFGKEGEMSGVSKAVIFH